MNTYCYFNYNSNDFAIDLDDVWKWIGYNQKDIAKKALYYNFKIDEDFILLNKEQTEKKKGRGGMNKDTYLMKMKTFKLLCLKASTDRSYQIHQYYIRLEEIIQNLINEEYSKLLEENEKQKKLIEEYDKKIIIEKELLREKTIIEQFPKNVQCVYYGLIDNVSTKGEKLIKFGNSNNLAERIDCHKKTYTNFRLLNAFRVSNKIHIENEIKNHSTLKSKRRNILINNKNYTELLAIDDFTFDGIFKIDLAGFITVSYKLLSLLII
jgi:phage anti-repressor protein